MPFGSDFVMAGSGRQHATGVCQLWPLLLSVLLCSSFYASQAMAARSFSKFHTSKKLARLREHLKHLNKPAIKSVESPDGDIIDCVVIEKQPAFDHPRLRNHEIQMEPPEFPAGLVQNVKSESLDNLPQFKPQLWHQEETCPSGTIPIRRTSESDLLRAVKIKHYGRKSHLPGRAWATPHVRDVLNENGHQHAISYVEGGNYYGAKSIINVWDPSIELSSEFSLSQLWVLAGSFEGDLNSIEAGWQVSPDLYGDNNTRLFTYWTSDAYQATGCYNLLCSGFVQISNQIAMGASISPVSAYGGQQFDIDILIWKDPKQGNWWMSFGNSYVLGYWPSTLFSFLADSATMVEWGGEVVNSDPDGHHTSTQMGSGHFPSEGFGRAAYFSNLQIVDSSNSLRPPANLNTFSENSGCYDVQDGYNAEWGYFFYYGGPGWNGNCE